MDEIVIREMNDKDIPQVQKMIEQLNAVFKTDHDISIKAIEKTFKTMKNKQNFYINYIALTNNKIVGFTSLVFYRTFFHPKGTLLINELIVDEENRGKKIGEKLLKKVFDLAVKHKVNEIEVGTTFENESAIKFYKKNGLKDESLLLGKEINE